MKNVFIDYLRRWRWVFLLASLYSVGFSLSGDLRTQRFALMASVFCGPLLLAMDLRKGFFRVLSVLPISKQSLSKLVWSMSVLLPVLIAIAGYLTGSLIGMAFQNERALDLGTLGANALAILAWTGSAFLVLTYLPMQTLPPGFANQLKGALAGGAWGFSIGGSQLFAMWAPVQTAQISKSFVAISVGLVAATVLGFIRAGTVFPGHGSGIDSSSPQPSGSPPLPWRPTSLTGEWFALFTIVKASLLVSVAFLGLFTVVRLLLLQGAVENFQDAFAWTRTFSMAGIAGAILALGWMGSLRHLRMLPISADRIAFAGCLFIWIPAMFFSCIGALLAFWGADSTAVWECVKTGLIGGALVNLIVACLMRIASLQLRLMIFMALWITSQMGAGLFAPLGGALLVASPFLAMAGYFLMRHNLIHHNVLYKMLPIVGMPQR